MADRFSAFAELMARIGYPERGANLLRAAAGNPALAARIDEVVASGDPVAARRLLADFMSLSDNPRVAPRDPSPISDMPVRPSTDDVQRRLVRAELGPIGDLPMPAVSRALGDIVAADGGDALLARLAQQAKPLYALDLSASPSVVSRADTGVPEPTATVDDLFVGAPAPAPPASGGALITQGGRGVPVGGPTGSGVVVPESRALSTQVTPRVGLPGRGPRRLETTAGVPQGRVDPRRPTAAEATKRPTPRLESPEAVAERRAIDDFARDVESEDTLATRLRVARFHARNLTGEMDGRRIAAGVGAGVAGAGLGHVANQFFDGPAGDVAPAPAGPAATRRGPTTADLAAESAPPPSVPVASGELTPREQAHELIARLNLMRRNAGGEVPEAPAMQREINRLLDMSNQTMAAAARGEVAMAGNDPHAQATRLLAQLNQMRRDAGGEVPEARQIMAEVSRLQQMGDAQRNARTTAFPRRAG